MTDYVELHAHSYFSLLDGTASPERLVKQAAALGMGALALTDHDALYGAVPFVQAARVAGIQPLLGAELTLEGGYHLTLLVENNQGWANLCWLISRAQHQAPKGVACLPPEALDDHTEGLIALSGCRQGRVASALEQGERKTACVAATWLLERFGSEKVWMELQHHFREEDDWLVAESVALARQLGIGVVATNNVHYAEQAEHRLQDMVVCIRHGVTIERSTHLRRATSEYHLKSPGEMGRLFREVPHALSNTRRIAEQCCFDLPTGLQALPLFPLPSGMDGKHYLRGLCEAAVARRYSAPSARVWEQMEYELGVIEVSGLTNYFLLVWDIVRFARERGILCQGRGSACNSLVAYLLDISPIDPLAHALVFERFLNNERKAVPDIDIDFQADRREEVIQYVFGKYGAAHVAMACTYSTYHARSALRDVGKVLGIPARRVDEVVQTLDWFHREALTREEALQGLAAQSPLWQQYVDLAEQIRGVPRHLGLHNGGMVLTRAPLATRVPTEPAAMPDRVVVQWDKDALEEAGLIKIDILGLRMLSMIAEAVALVEQETGERLDLQGLTYDNPRVYKLLQRADTIGVFQTESGAQMSMLPRLKPACFHDLIIAVSLIRPGPLQGQMVHPFLRRRRREEPVRYAHPSLEAALGESLGVILWQEQVLKVARDFAGFSAEQGEVLRRALGKKHAAEALKRFRDDFIQGAMTRGIATEVAQEVWEQLRAFGGYSFAKSHAAAFSVLVYQSAYLKCYHHAAFSAALLNHQPMGFWSSSVLVNDARRHGVDILPVSIQHSEKRCAAVEGALRLGLSLVKHLGEAGSQRIVSARGTRPFTNLLDFCRRSRLPRHLVEHLVRAGAMDEWQRPRRELLWELGTLHYREEEFEIAFPTGEVILPPLSARERLGWEREILGLSGGAHLLSLYRAWLRGQGIMSSRDLKHHVGKQIKVAGEVVRHQAPPTAKGVHFLTLEDEDGLISVVVRPDVYLANKVTWRTATLLIVEGVVQHLDGVTNLVAHQAVRLQPSEA